MTFWGLLDDAARRVPDAVVLADDHGRSLTTAALRDAAGRAAAGLHGHGVEPGDVVSWQLPTTLEAVVLLAACARLGAVQNPVIPAFRHREVGFIVRQVSARLVVVPESWHGFGHGEMARSLGSEVLALDLDGPPGSALRLPEGDSTGLPAAPARADECRWIYYSSGTTADPKGARHTDASVIASSDGVVAGLGFGAGDVYPIAWPIGHIGGVSMLAAALRAGGTLVLFDAFDPAVTPERMAAHRPTILGSATPEPVSREVAEVLGVPGVLGSWGLTEFPVATSETPTDAEPGTTVGRPAAGVRVRVVAGELRLKGPQCFLGYQDAALDADAFDADGWLRTGDLGDVDEQGRVRGRLKEVVIRNAENISAAEVERVLARHPAVRDVAVVGVPDERTGERVCAVVVVGPGGPGGPGDEVTLAALVAHCRAEGLARHKCPERLEVVDELPRSPMGKVLRRELEGWLTSAPGGVIG
ncbi:Cyclohexanecarboxylate-CoA ligase [Frankia sp. Hr75.2]|nr:Cyclohexanecarboxylate-CoA ligase [Frankia sp. Hr75.2]